MFQPSGPPVFVAKCGRRTAKTAHAGSSHAHARHAAKAAEATRSSGALALAERFAGLQACATLQEARLRWNATSQR